MNATSRAILQTVLTSDATVAGEEQGILQALINGQRPPQHSAPRPAEGPLLLTQKEAARMLSVSRVTLWRMTRDGVFRPIEILPGTVRYAYEEIAAFARGGWTGLQKKMTRQIVRKSPDHRAMPASTD